MNRQILFRGKNRYRKEWLYGSLSQYRDGSYGIDGVPVETDSVGQFTGLRDKDSRPIYEGDIIRIDSHAWLDWKEFDGVNAEIVYDNGTFEARWKNPDAGKPYPFQNPDDEEDVEAEYVCEFIGDLPNTIEVIGSIHDTPELLNEKER